MQVWSFYFSLNQIRFNWMDSTNRCKWLYRDFNAAKKNRTITLFWLKVWVD